MLKGLLGLESARIPHADRHGLLWLGRGQLYVEAGTLRFRAAGGGDLERGDYALPFQMISCILLQAGTTVSHDALRLLARHSTGVVCVGEDGVRFYASLPGGAGQLGPRPPPGADLERPATAPAGGASSTPGGWASCQKPTWKCCGASRGRG
jgi:hypothetical protein